MNWAERRHPTHQGQVWCAASAEMRNALLSDWPFQPGDKVKLDIDKIMNDQEYERKLLAYREFCEMNIDRVFTVEYMDGMSPSVVCFAENESHPKWLFWTGDLKAV